MFPARRVRRARESSQVVTVAPLDADDGGASASTVQLTYVFLVPCHDVAALIGETLRSLLKLPAARTHVLVVDDGSDDDTAAVALTHPRDRVTVIQRQLPHARKGRGSAVKAGLRMVRRISLGDPDTVVVGLLGAAGRVEPAQLSELDRRFADVTLLGTRMGAPDRRRAARRPRPDDDLRSPPADRSSALAWFGHSPGRFVRLSALADVRPVGG